MVLGQLHIHMPKKGLWGVVGQSRYRPYVLHKNELKINHRLNVKHRTITLLENNAVENPDELGLV